MRAFWWNAQPNFGDVLTPFLIQRLFGVIPEWAAPSDAEVVVVGSVIDLLPADWTGVIAGAGKLHETAKIPPRAGILGLRGHLSARGVRGNYTVGDPGLLVDECVPPQEKVHNLGVVPHWTDKVLADRFAHLDPFVIDPRNSPSQVITEIARCKKIVSSSLHGIVVADAFGIPRRAETFPAMNSPYEGGVFKFEDYSSGIGCPMKFGVVQEPDRERIENAQAELFEMLREESHA